MPETSTKELSFFTTQMNALGLDQTFAHHPEVEQEKEILQNMNLPKAPWVKENSRKRYFRRYFAIAAMIVGFAIVYQYQDQRFNEQFDLIRAKGFGDPQVLIYVEKGTTLSIWDNNSPLTTGDSFQVKVAATKPLTAYLIPTDRDGALLERPEQIIADRIELSETLNSVTFPQVYTLTAENVGETIRVLTCQPSFTATTDDIIRSVTGQTPKSCIILEQRVRP